MSSQSESPLSELNRLREERERRLREERKRRERHSLLLHQSRLSRHRRQEERLMLENHDQTMSERKQRQQIGGWVAWIAFGLPIVILLAFWTFFIFFSKDADKTLLSVMFSTTHISAVLLYFALIRGMFQTDKQDNKTPAEQIKPMLDESGDGD